MATVLDTSIAKTSLAAVKRQANIASGITTYDDVLNEYINIASQEITTRLNRELVATDYVKWIDGRGEDELVMDEYPLIRVNLLATGRNTAMTVQYSGSDAKAAAQVTDTGLRLTSWGTTGVTTTEVDWATYEAVSAVVTQINDNVTGWTATLKEDGPSKWLRPQGGRDAKTAAIDIDAPDCFDREYDVKYESGMIQFHGWRSTAYGFGTYAETMRPTNGMGMGGAYLSGAAPFGGLSILADYRAGYETIPADIEQVARDKAVTMFREKFRDASVKSESLGSYSYTLADQAAEEARHETVLNRYMREVLA